MKVHLKKLEVCELHKRRFNLRLDGLPEGVAIVYGPNAAGKTVLTEGASRVFSATDRKTVGRTDRILGLIHDGQRDYQIDIPSPQGAIPWPQSSRVGLYRLSVADLIRGPHEDDHKQIKEALAGGLDLSRLEPVGPGRKPKTLDDAREELLERQTAAACLRRQESELAYKREELAQVRQAKKGGELLERWLNAADHDRNARQLEEQIRQLEQEHPGIGRQAENAPAQLRYDAYVAARTALQRAKDALEPFEHRRVRLPLQAVHDQQLKQLRDDSSTLNVEKSGAERAVDTAESQVQQAQRQLNNCHVNRAPIPLTAADRQELYSLAQAVLGSEKALEISTAEVYRASQALAQSEQAFRNARGNPEQHPVAAPNADLVQQALVCDAEITQARSVWCQAQQAVDEAKRARDQQKVALPNIRIPAQTALEDLQKDPAIALLMDRLRELETRRTSLEAIAQQLGSEAEQAVREAKDADLATDALRDWLRAIPADTVGTGLAGVITVASLLAVVVLVIGAVVGWLVGTIAGAVSLAAMAVMLILRSRRRQPGDGRAEMATRVPVQWQPTQWTTDHVAVKYAEALRKIERLNAAKDASRDARTRVEQVDDHSERDQLQARWDLFTLETGIAATDGYDLANLVHGLQRLHDVERRFQQATENDSVLHGNLDTRTLRRQELMRAIGSPCETGADTTAWANSLKNLLDQSSEYQKAIKAKEAEQGEATEAGDRLVLKQASPSGR